MQDWRVKETVSSIDSSDIASVRLNVAEKFPVSKAVFSGYNPIEVSAYCEGKSSQKKQRFAMLKKKDDR